MSQAIPQPVLTSDALNKTEIKGIFASDLIIRSALVAAIKDMRQNDWLLDYAFASLAQDDLTSKDYGFNDIERAKSWFKQNDIEVRLDISPNPPKFPCISVLLAQSAEEENTLGDVHHQTAEGLVTPWPVLAGPFVPLKYDALTGRMTLPQSVADQVDVSVSMVLIDRVGKTYTIIQVDDSTHISLNAGTLGDFSEVVIKAAAPAYNITIESASFKETYSLGCAVDSEPVHLIYLHSIVVFALLRYRQDLLEARGFERTAISSTETRKNPIFETESCYTRYIALTGYARQSWPKVVKPRIASLNVQTVIETGAQTPGAIEDELTWISDLDGLAQFPKNS